MPDTSVKFFHSEMQGAPVLSGTVGALIAVLDACLVNGFGLKTADSLTVNNNVATLAFTGGHPFETDAVTLVAGATPAGLNGAWKVTATTPSTVQFATSGISNQTATGTISAKLAPAGWAKAFTGTNKAAYKPTDVQATGCLMRIDDSTTTTARVAGYETMGSVDTGTGLFPLASQVAGGMYWSKSQSADSTAKKWMVFADARSVYVSVESTGSSYPGCYQTVCFGDILAAKSGDAYACTISGAASDQAGTPNNTSWLNYSSSNAMPFYAARSFLALGGSVQLAHYAPPTSGNGEYCSGNASMPFPNPADGGIYLSPLNVLEVGMNALRGIAPGIYLCPQRAPNGFFSAKDRIGGVTSLVGRTLLTVTDWGSGSGHFAPFFFDITGPWR
jgi:hypothetical protein